MATTDLLDRLSDYEIRHLTAHLDAAGMFAELIRVMTGVFPEAKLARLGSAAEVARDYTQAIDACQRQEDLGHAVSFALRRSLMIPEASALSTADVPWLVSGIASSERNLEFARRSEALAREFIKDPREAADVLAGLAGRLPAGPDRQRLLEDAARVSETLPLAERRETLFNLIAACINGEPPPGALLPRALEMVTPGDGAILQSLILSKDGAADAGDRRLAAMYEPWALLPPSIRHETLATAVDVWNRSQSPIAGAAIIRMTASGRFLASEQVLSSLIEAAIVDRHQWIAYTLSGNAGYQLTDTHPLAVVALASALGRGPGVLARARRVFRLTAAFALPYELSARFNRRVWQAMMGPRVERPRPMITPAEWGAFGAAVAHHSPGLRRPPRNLDARIGLLSARSRAGDSSSLAQGALRRCLALGSQDDRRGTLLRLSRASFEAQATGVAREALERWLTTAFEPKGLREFRYGLPLGLVYPVVAGIAFALTLVIGALISTFVVITRFGDVIANAGSYDLALGLFFFVGLPLWLFLILLATKRLRVRISVMRARSGLRSTLASHVERVRRGHRPDLDVIRGLLQGAARPREYEFLRANVRSLLDWCVARAQWDDARDFGLLAFRLGDSAAGRSLIGTLERARSAGLPAARGVGTVEGRIWAEGKLPSGSQIVELAGALASFDLEAAWRIAREYEGGRDFPAFAIRHAATSQDKRRLAFEGTRLLSGQPPDDCLPGLLRLLRRAKRERVVASHDAALALKRLGAPKRGRRAAWVVASLPVLPLGLALSFPAVIVEHVVFSAFRWIGRPILKSTALRSIKRVV